MPLLRPLRHPGSATVDEQLRLATIAALIEHKPSADPSLAARLAIDPALFPARSHLIRVGHQLYSDQPPMLAFLLSGPGWILHWLGFPLDASTVFTPYLLTLIGATLPAAAAAGLIYRMGRIFELRRPIRCGLAAATVFATGIISYAVVINAYVPAAVFSLGAMGCLVHLSASQRPERGGAWLVLSGLCAALAATINLWAVLVLAMLVIVIPTMRLPIPLRIGGIALYLLGAAPIILLHGLLVVHLTGNLLPGSMHRELAAHESVASDDQAEASPTASNPEDADLPDPDLENNGTFLTRLIGQFFGSHGLLTHFPAILCGVAGVFAVMHRHWPPAVKVMAAISGIAVAAVVVSLAWSQRSPQAFFAEPQAIIFLPMLLFWSGAWLRRAHRPFVWSAAGVLLIYSVIFSLVGATDPMPAQGYARFTVAAADQGPSAPGAQDLPIVDR